MFKTVFVFFTKDIYETFDLSFFHLAVELADSRDGLNELEISWKLLSTGFVWTKYFFVSLTFPRVFHQNAF